MALAETAKLIAQLVLDDKLTPGVNKAIGSVGRLDKGMGRTAKGLGQVQSGLFKAGTRIAAGLAVAGAAAVKVAGDFDDAFASVEKNVEGSTGEIAKLKDDLHALATRIPVKFDDLTAIAAEAGALGIATPDVVRFTETMARLSKATQGLTVEAASEAFGKFRNSLHLTEDEIERSASALVTLGKTAGSSEGDIIEVAKRFAGAGASSKLSAAQILGLSSAIASLGVAPEAAGGSLSRLFNAINKDIGTSDKKLDAFAKTAGVSTKAFAKAFQKDALGTFEKFLAGLSKLSGPEQQKALKNAGINNVRDISALQLLAGSWQEVSKQTDAATASYQKNTDLTDTSNKRFDTFNNKLTLLGNNVKEVAFNIGEGMTPAIGRAADKLTALLQDKSFLGKAKQIGTTIGDAIDKIDWRAVVDGAKSFADALSPALTLVENIFKVVNALPTEVKGAGLGFLALDKLSGGLVGAGAGNIVGGLGESLAKSLAASIPVFGSAFVQPVRVVNFPSGFGLPGGVGGAGGAAGGIAPELAPLGAFATGATLATAGALSTIGNQIGVAITGFINDVIPSPEPVKENVSRLMQAYFDNVLPNPGAIQRDIQNLFDFVTGKHPEAPETLTRPGGRDTDKLNNGLEPATRRVLAQLADKASLNKEIGRLGQLEDKLAHAKESGDDRRISNLRGKVETQTQRVDSMKAALTQTTNATRDAARRAGMTTTSATDAASAAIVKAIYAAVPNIDIFVSSTDVQTSIKRHNRAGPGSGSAGTSQGGGTRPGDGTGNGGGH